MSFLSRVPVAVRQQAKAFLGGAVAAVVAAEAPLVQGGSWSLTTLYAAAVSAVVAYAAVYLTANAPRELTAVEQLLAALVGQATASSGHHAAVPAADAHIAWAQGLAAPLPAPIPVPVVTAPAVDFTAVAPVSLAAATPLVPPAA